MLGAYSKVSYSLVSASKMEFCLVALAAALTSLSLIYISYIFAWFAFSILFFALFRLQKGRQVFCSGFIFGAVSSTLLNFWMVPAVQYYAKGGILLGIACWWVSALILALVYGWQFVLFAKLQFASSSKYALVANAFLMASLWALVEWLRAEIFSGMPWLNYSIGVSQASNLFLLQPAAIGSVYLLSFMVILTAYLLAYVISKKQWKWLLVPFTIFLSYFLAGILMYRNVTESISNQQFSKIRTALVLASLPPETVWDENNGNALVHNLLNLNQEAVQTNPDLILWSETIIPWTYTPHDDFLKALAKTTSGKKITP
ncbi:hypothetical protein [Adhaeribacter pallidiroseus]|uniref:Apolipoprotein N-acyltransferase N-terminal domain-containing protein n=1 Tax=Adhaeribacter pallidiroseus TaxID=2072847 RepID=A0A369Q2S0_9BACT|nr:hypothetical protein [Adhaeribacter pallidiroseus]RDC58812.1 hypothetical protein AHMF7616_05246 [Adhaeribacter pallidiroseus]